MKGQILNPLPARNVTSRDVARDGDKIIWTLQAIGRRIGVGSDFVKDVIAQHPRTPVRELGGKYYAFEADLVAFMRDPDGTA